ncbi:endonuclease/exonuclease/phosphatase family protein [Gordonia sp. VNK21]|uniref:endonuclease/exonuclease/phosphatase family protein n=1 Tax=Gordonia sp. VNK21 TaxID=3382483 RepID=UPI0038D3C5B0
MATQTLRRGGLIISGAMVAAGAAGIIAHYSWLESNWLARVGAFAPVLMGIGLLGTLLALAVRGWWVAGVGAVLVVVSVISQAPLYIGSGEPGTGDLTVMQANIYLGQADVDALAKTVADKHVDILTVAELTDPALSRIEASAIAEQLPYTFVKPAEHGAGIGLFSRYPLTDAGALDGFRMANARAVVQIPGHGEYAVYALHPLPPYPEPAWRWTMELDRLSEILHDETRPVIAAGDFNSTYDHRQLRDLLSDSDGGPGLTDAAEHTGAGIIATYPANRWFPAMLALDRVMTRGGPEAVDFYRVEIPGSDHHGVVAEIDLR